MENASDALIMAASVLLAMMIISLGVYLFSSFANTAEESETIIFEKNVNEFNSRFLKFENAEQITIHDIVSLANFARDNNLYYAGQEGNINVNNRSEFFSKTSNLTSPYIHVFMGTERLEYKSIEELNEYIGANTYKNSSSDLQYYTCTNDATHKSIWINDATRKVEKIVFQKQP